MKQKKALNFQITLKKQSNNKAVIACAGSGKTSYLVEEALKLKNQKILIITYTNENLDQIKSIFYMKNGCIPSNVSVQSWFTFLLQEGVRPYQNYKSMRSKVKSIYFFDEKKDKKLISDLKYIKEENENHYLTKNCYIYADKVSKFVYKCNEKNNGLTVKRLEKIYDYILIDEAQDLEAWDYDLVGNLLDSLINIILVGDPRQKILETHRHLKNNKFNTIFDWLLTNKKVTYNLEEKTESYRCNQIICDFADNLFPDLPKTTSKNNFSTNRVGIFTICEKDVDAYIKEYQPKILRYNKTTNTLGYPAINIGYAKGRTYDHVLIFPTKKMLEYLKTKNLSKVGDKCKLYVAVTRAKYSVTFVTKN